MARSLQKAWSSLQSGRYRKAKTQFREAVQSGQSQPGAHLGLAAAAMGEGDLREATTHAEEALKSGQRPEASLLLGEIHSRSGNRDQAEAHIQNYFDQGGSSAYGRALLGEQRVRTARWDQGIDDFVEALHNDDRQGRAYRHLEQVLADLTGAASSGALPTEAAEKFVNTLEFNLGDVPTDAQQYFASVRRALKQGRALDGPENQSPIFELIEASGTGSSGVSSSSRAPQGPPGGAGAPPSANSGGSGSAPPTPASSADTQKAPASKQDQDGIQARQKDLAGVIQQDRQANEQLQQQIGQRPPPRWPTERKDSLDPLPRMAWEEQSIFADAPSLDTSDFRVTSGSVRTEIFLDRCLHGLLAGAKSNRTISIRFRPEAISQIEMNCFDGLLDDLPPLSDIYDEFQEGDQYEALALGRFIGECVARHYDGTWDFDEPPERSRLVVGMTSLDPIGLAQQWVAAEDPNDVDLQSLVTAAIEASEASASLTVEENYIDPTRELQGESLAAAVAELWVDYLFRLDEASFGNVSETLDVRQETASLLVATLDPQYAPPAARGREGTGLLEDGTVALGYLRETGEFLVLAMRKQAARAAKARFGTLDPGFAEDAASFLADYHRPGWFWIVDKSTAQEVDKNQGNWSPSPPRISQGDNGRVLEVEALAGNSVVRVRLRAPHAEDASWRIEYST